MNWKTSLDRYLTAPLEDGFDNWCYLVENSLTDPFYNKNEDWVQKSNGQCNKWLNILFDRSKDPFEAATIIERAFNIYHL